MTAITNTYVTSNSNRNREVFADTISMTTPEETPLVSLIGSESVDGVNPTWSLDALATPSTTNKRAQGDQYSWSATAPTTRVGNHTQIMMKEFIIAKTQEAVSKAGAKSDYNREKLKKGIELKTDLEVTIASNNPSIAASGATAGQLGGLRAWLTTNDSLGSTGASGGFSSGIVGAATNGTQRTFTKALLDDNIQSVYQAGGNPSILMLSPYLKRVFSSFMADANVAAQRSKAEGKEQVRIYAAADEYLSDFGLLTAMPNRQWARVGAAACRNAFLIEPSKLAIGVLREVAEDPNLAVNADAKPGAIVQEKTLIVKNEAALGVIADLFGFTAAS